MNEPREILFRGKRKDNGEWIYGSLVKYYYKSFIVPDNVDYTYMLHTMFQEAREVDPKTVGQYTGLNDVSGRKIFEGDILSVLYASIENGSFFEHMDVYYELDYAQYYVGYRELYEVSNNSEVIGNIHDNPELLEVK